MKKLLLILLIIAPFLKSYAENVDSVYLEIMKSSDTIGNITDLIGHASLNSHENHQVAFEYYKLAENLAQKYSDTCANCILYYGQGILAHGKSEYEKALNYYHKAYESSKACHNTKILINSTNNMGVLNRYAKNFPKAIEWYELALRFSREYNDTLKMLHALNNLGNVYHQSGDFNKAIQQYENCLREIENSGAYDFFRSSVYPNLAQAYYDIGKFDKAIELFEESYRLAKEADIPYIELIVLRSISEIYLERNHPEKALSYLNKAIPLLKEFYNEKIESDIYMLRYQAQLALGNHEAAIKDLEKYQSLQDSLDLQEMHVLLSDIQEKYDNEKLKRITTKQEKTIQDRNRLLLLFGLSGIIVLGFLIFSIYLNQYRKKTNKSLKQKQTIINEGLAYGRFVKEKLMISKPKILANRSLKHFIYDKPKHGVGGDFYLFKEHPAGLFVILGDATGHGVPGGFISLTVLNLFHQTLENEKDLDPAKLLHSVKSQWEAYSNAQDKYDESFTASVACINSQTIILANHKQKSLLYKDGKIIHDGKKSAISEEILQNEYSIKSGDWLILSSDGYYDQIGGEKGKTYKFKQFSNFIEQQLTSFQTNLPNVIENEIVEFMKGEEQTDDMLVIGIGF